MLLIELQGFFMCSGYKAIFRYLDCECFLSSCGLLFSFLDGVFQRPEVLNFDNFPLTFACNLFMFFVCF